MCLSTVYKLTGGEQEKVCEYVSGIAVGDGSVTLTDIMGDETVLSGIIRSIDLVKNIILVDSDD